MPETPVRVRDCACPDTPHEGHFVYLAEALPFRAGFFAERIIVGAAGKPAEHIQAELIEAFVREGVTRWDLVDAEGAPLPFDVDEILRDYSLSRPVALAIEAKGWDSQVLDPLLAAVRPSTSPSGRTDGSTSRRRGRSRTPSA